MADDLCCPVTCGMLQLADALRMQEREARRGVCDTGRYRCAYSTWGEGPPLAFIPGLSDDASCFVLPMALLKGSFRCIAYDLPTGRGDGARLGRYRHADFVADLLALLDHLGARRCYLFGSSFGSTIALAAMHDFPARFPRAVLQGGFARRPLAWAEVTLARLARYWPWPMRCLPLREPILGRAHHAPFAARPDDVWQYFLQCWGKQPMAAVARRALVLHQLDLRPLLPQIRQPVLMICGDADPLVGKPCEEELLRGLPHVARIQLHGCGHLPVFTHPEALAAAVVQFLTPPGSQQQMSEPGPSGSGVAVSRNASAAS
jgi:pimeloyl-ACP methyl ester carboxylesterase